MYLMLCVQRSEFLFGALWLGCFCPSMIILLLAWWGSQIINEWPYGGGAERSQLESLNLILPLAPNSESSQSFINNLIFSCNALLLDWSKGPCWQNQLQGHLNFFPFRSHCTVRISTRRPLLRAVSFSLFLWREQCWSLNWKRSQIPSASSKHQIPSFISVALFCKQLKGIGWSWCEG